MAKPTVKDWAQRSAALDSILSPRNPSVRGGDAERERENKTGPIPTNLKRLNAMKPVGETGTQKQDRLDRERKERIEKEYASRPTEKYRKGQIATIKGQTGPISDVMWDSKKRVWTYSIQVWSEKTGDHWIDGDEADVKVK